MKAQLKTLRRHIRRFLGSEAEIARLEKQQQMLKEVISLLRYSVLDTERVKSSITYVRCSEIISLLTPMDVKDGNFIRVGRNNDGGYVMLDNFDNKSVSAAYSFGISNDVSWDEAMAARGVEVYMFDHTITKLPKDNPKFHFFRKGVTGYLKSEHVETLSDLLIKNGHAESNDLILKMDVEACEWDVFLQTPSSVIDQFAQIVIELHELCPVRGDAHHRAVVDSLSKINLTHQSIHVHANINCTPIWIGGKILPDLMEITFIRRKDVEGRLVENTRMFPTALDQPTYEGLPDLQLGYFR